MLEKIQTSILYLPCKKRSNLWADKQFEIYNRKYIINMGITIILDYYYIIQVYYIILI